MNIFAAIFDLNGSKGLGEKGICTKGVVHSKKLRGVGVGEWSLHSQQDKIWCILC